MLETIDVMDNYRTATRREKFADKIDFWIEPDLGDMSQYSLKQVRFAREKGYEVGKEYAAKIKEKLRK